MDTISNFLAMDGYGGFIWPAYGATALVLVGLLLVSLKGLRRREAELAALGGGDGSDDEAQA